MKRLFRGRVALVALGWGAPAAFAAERPVPAYAPPPPPPPAYTWSGCYIGASAGTSNGRSQHFTTAGSTISPSPVLITAGAPPTHSLNLSGFIARRTPGGNREWGARGFCSQGGGAACNKDGQGFGTGCWPARG